MKSVSSRLLLLVLAISMTGMGLIAVIGNVLAGEAISEQTLGWIGESTARNSSEIDKWIVNHTRYVAAIASDFSATPDIGADALLPYLIGHTKLNDDFYSVYAGYPDGTGVFDNLWQPDYSKWKATERDWYMGAAASPNKTYVTELYLDADSGNVCITLSQTFTHGDAMAGVVAVDIFTKVLDTLVNSVDVGKDSYGFLIDKQGNIIVHNKSEYAPTIKPDGGSLFHNIYTIDNNRYANLKSAEVLNGGSIKLRDEDGELRYYTARAIPTTGWMFFTCIPVRVVNAPIARQITVAAIVFVAVLVIAATLLYLSLRGLIVRPVKDVARAANLLALGETGISLNGKYVGEIALLADSFRGMESFNRQQAEWLEHIADGDLTIDVKPRGERDRTAHAIVSMLDHLNDMFAEIDSSTYQVANGSKQIADGAQSLAQGSTEQASAVDELSVSIGVIAGKTKHNADTANEAAHLSDEIRANAEMGSSQMSRMMEAVKEINESSNSIRNVIKTIDDIAFQTNILALNAAVEAARAGQHGKGFAVVAEEVRNLAAKSAEAAKNTSGLIADSIDKANLGLAIADETSTSLQKIVDGIIKSAEIVDAIARASDEQAASITKVNTGIDQVTLVVQKNTATAEESAAASEEMSGQTSILADLVARFKLKDVTKMR